MQSEELPFWLNNIFTYPKKSTCIVVPGGGEFADQIRVSQKYFNFSDEIAHKMALLAMSQYGYFLTGINKSIKIIKNILVKEGVFLSKVFMGSIFKEINQKAKESFKKVVNYKPAASKKESKEIYIYCKGI